jgi:hypothetical protein
VASGAKGHQVGQAGSLPKNNLTTAHTVVKGKVDLAARTPPPPSHAVPGEEGFISLGARPHHAISFPQEAGTTQKNFAVVFADRRIPEPAFQGMSPLDAPRREDVS